MLAKFTVQRRHLQVEKLTPSTDPSLASKQIHKIQIANNQQSLVIVAFQNLFYRCRQDINDIEWYTKDGLSSNSTFATLCPVSVQDGRKPGAFQAGIGSSENESNIIPYVVL